MKRIIIHWTAGRHTPNAIDKRHYHLLIDGAGQVHKGDFPIEANSSVHRGKLTSGTYAAHTANCNTDSIGIALCAMAGAQERPFSPGSAPITARQISALSAEVAALSSRYGIPITRETVLTHAEVQPTLGIQQAGKWDITWLPGMSRVGDPVVIGDMLRAAALPPERPQPRPEAPQEDGIPPWAIIAFLAIGLAAAFIFGGL